MNSIRDLCKDISLNRVYNWKDIPKRMLLNAVTNLDNDEEKLVLFYDSSVLETGRTGIAICDNGIHWKDISTPPGYLSWEDFLDIEVSHDDYYIYLGDNEGVFVFNRDVKVLIELLTNIRASLKGMVKSELIAKDG